ncbi:MAG: tetratricopeptide repeat protein [Ornithinimicrobium sp.]
MNRSPQPSRYERGAGGGDRRGSPVGRPPRSPGPQGNHLRPQSDSGQGRDFARPRTPEPELPDDLTADLADRSIHRELRTLSKENAEGVARHLLAVSELVDRGDIDRALEHALTATRRAGRVPIVREMLGVVHYRRGEWAKALAEFRTARRLSGSHHLLPLMADCERGLGRPERAIELGRGSEVASLRAAERIELALVVAGARADLGQTDAAVHQLAQLTRTVRDDQAWAARVYYAYAGALSSQGQHEAASQWLRRAARFDTEQATDAAVRLGLVAQEPAPVDPIGEVLDLAEND